MTESRAAAAGSSPVRGLTPPSRRTGAKRRIGDVIVMLGFAERERIESVAADGRARGPASGRVAARGRRRRLPPARACAGRAQRLHFVDLSQFEVDNGAAGLIDAAKARRYRSIPIAFVGEGTVLVATADPANVLAFDDIAMATGHEVVGAVASPEHMER